MGGVGKIGFIRTVRIRYSCLCLSCAPSSKKPHLFIYDFLACNSLRPPTNALLHIADQIRPSMHLESFRKITLFPINETFFDKKNRYRLFLFKD